MTTKTTAEVVTERQVSHRTLRRMVDSGELRYTFKFPTATGGYLFDADEVDRVFAARAEKRVST